MSRCIWLGFYPSKGVYVPVYVRVPPASSESAIIVGKFCQTHVQWYIMSLILSSATQSEQILRKLVFKLCKR